jgi:hypothetical protein
METEAWRQEPKFGGDYPRLPDFAVALMKQNICPVCDAHEGFYEGPSGGFSTNIKCAACGAEFNYSPLGAERIPRHDR